MKRLKEELEKVQESILKMKNAHPDRMEKLKVSLSFFFLLQKIFFLAKNSFVSLR